MNNVASILVLIFLAITFIMSAHDKIFHWKDNITWLNGHFEKTYLKNHIQITVFVLLITELLAGVFSVVGCIQLYINGGRTFGFYGALFSCVALLFMLFGQRLAKDFDGARNIVIYFIPAVLAVYWLG